MPKVKALTSDRKAVLELWDQNSSLLGSNWLFGEANIYDVELDKIFWRHVYGGAFNAPYKNEADQMVRGGWRRPSTYHGSIAVRFSSRPSPVDGLQKKIDAELKERKGRLCVRLFRAIYLPETFRKTRVSVVVQIGGGFLPDGKTKVSLNAAAEDVVAVQYIRQKEGQFNRCLLSFPGEVDANGHLTLHTSNHANSKKTGEGYDWIQRSTPLDHPLTIPPDITHAYLYIVKDGHEESPPMLYSRIRVVMEDTLKSKETLTARQDCAENFLNQPRWKRIRWDPSVSELPSSVFQDDFAGFILGAIYVGKSVPLKEGEEGSPFIKESGMGEDRELVKDLEERFDAKYPKASMPKSVMCRPCLGETYVNVGSSGEPTELLLGITQTKKQRVWAHVDVIACRSLRATDPDGLCDPCYLIQVEDKVLKHYLNRYMDVPIFEPKLHAPDSRTSGYCGAS
jgi:hypothetical protein